MGPVVAAVFGFAAVSGTAAVIGVTLARIALVALAARLTAKKPSLPDIATSKLLSVRSTQEPRRSVYGRDLISGPIVFLNTGGTENRTLYQSVAVCSHQVTAIPEVWIDIADGTSPNTRVLNAQIDGTTLNVTAGKFAEVNPTTPVMRIARNLGSQTQAVDPILSADFPTLWVATQHDLKGVAFFTVAMTLVKDNEDVYKTAPTNLRALVDGKALYDPRLDSTNGGVGLHRLADPTTWAISSNPALCLVDYLRASGPDYPLTGHVGFGEADSRINYDLVRAAADVCDQLPVIPVATTQRRYTFNGTIDSSMPHRQIIDQMVGAMLGRIVFVDGQWSMFAGEVQAATITITGRNLRGEPVDMQAQSSHRERWNRVRGKFIDPVRFYAPVGYAEQRSTTFQTSDGGDSIYRDEDFAFADNEFECQRNAIKILKQSRNQKVLSMPCNWSVMRLQPGITVTVDLPELSQTAAKFLLTEWKLAEDGGGIDLTLVEEDDAVWTDPLESEYSQRTHGVIAFNDLVVGAPLNLSAIGVPGAIDLSWLNPVAELFDVIEVFASLDSAFANAVVVGETRDNTFSHSLPKGGQRFYWVRARKGASLSLRNPDSDISNVTATAAFNVGGGELSGTTVEFIYDDLETTGEAPTQGQYALLSVLATNTSGITQNFETALGLLVNNLDTGGTSHEGFFDQVVIDNTFTYYISDSRWYHFRISSIETPPSNRHKFGLEIISYMDVDDSPVVSGAAGVGVKMRFNMQPQELRETINGIQVGVTGDLLFFKNASITEQVNIGDVRVRGSYIQDPDTDVKKSFNRGNTLAQVATPFEGTGPSTDAAYLMWTDQPMRDRFTTLLSGENHEIAVIEYNNATSTWEALDNALTPTREAFIPLATDILIAKIVRTNTLATGGLDLLQSFINYQPGDDLIKADIFIEDFTGRDVEARYIEAVASTPPGTISYVEAGDVGGVVFQVAGGRRWFELDRLFPFNPTLLYKFTVKVRQTVTSAVTNTFFMGFAGVGQDGVTRISVIGTDTPTLGHWVAAGTEDLEADLGLNNWGTFIGYLKGHDTDNNLNSREDPFDPAHAETGIVYFRPAFVMNNPTGTGTTQIDYFKVEVIPDTDIPDIGQSGLIPDPQFNRTALDGTFWQITPTLPGSAITVEKDLGVTGNVVRTVVVTAGSNGQVRSVPHRIHSTVTTNEQVRVTARWRRTTAVGVGAQIFIAINAVNADFTDIVAASPTGGIAATPSAATINEWQELTGVFTIQNNPKNVAQVPFVSVTLTVDDLVNGTIEWDSVQVRSI